MALDIERAEKDLRGAVGYLKQASAYMRDNETAKAQIAEANADRAQAQIDLLNYQLF